MNTRMFTLAAALIAAFGISHAAPLRQERFALSIESGSLISVLEQLSHQTGLHLGAEISVMQSRVSDFGPFVAYATVDDVLRQLLTGTDLWYAWRDEDTIRLFLISAQRINWSTDISTVQEASDSIRELSGARFDTGSCSKLPVGPFSPSHPITAEEYWVELIKPHCTVIHRPSAHIDAGSVDRETVAGQTRYNFSIEQMPRLRALRRISEQAGIEVGYLSTNTEEEQALVDPIVGDLSADEALKRAMQDTPLRARWVSHDIVNVEPAYTMVAYADMSKCPCNFGLPEWRPLQSEHITVTKPRLPALEESSPAPVTTFDHSFIDATGASTIPELLNYLAQQAFSPARGYRATGAQYFEGRGFGAQYSLILINGHRAYGSAGDPMTNALDLNVVPLSAVERIEVAVDQPSVLYGTDGIGGTVNIVLKRDLQDTTAQTSLGSAPGGSEKTLFTLLADGASRSTKAGFVFDHLARGDLLGSKRDRWRNQDYTRYDGGLDYRTPLGTPANVYSLAGDLPGAETSFGTISMGPTGPVLRPNDTNRQSALAYAAIVPEQQRSSLYAFSSTDLGSAELNLKLLWGRQSASLRQFPVGVAGLTWGANHYQNPFGVDVVINALLTGLPPRTQEAESTLTRVTADLSGSFGGWGYSAFLVTQQDRSHAWFTHEVDPMVLAHSLTTENSGEALNVLGERPGEGPVPAELFLQPHKSSYLTRSIQTGLNLSGPLATWVGGDIMAEAGLSHRRETVLFDESLGQLDRDISSLYARVHVPLISAANTSIMRGLKFAIGARRDFHNDVSDITTKQYSLSWQPLSAIKVHAAYSELFRPPSLYELNLPRFQLPFQIFDPKRSEVTEITLITGGNPSLHPTEGQSIDFGVSLHADNGVKGSINYWDTRMRDRIWLVLAQDLMNVPSQELASRIIRADPTSADIDAKVPGRLLALDTTRANFGAVEARGFDISFQRSIKTAIGRITPRIDITRTLNFRYRDLPGAPLVDRAGVASLYGTVPSGRAMASLLFDSGQWRASVFARHHSSYQDYSTVEGAATKYRVPAQTLFDVKLSKDINDHLSLSVGAINVLDDQAPFAQVGGWEGYDQFQGNLLGREAYLNISGSF